MQLSRAPFTAIKAQSLLPFRCLSSHSSYPGRSLAQHLRSAAMGKGKKRGEESAPKSVAPPVQRTGPPAGGVQHYTCYLQVGPFTPVN